MPLKRITLDTTADVELGDAAHDSIGSFVLHVSGTFEGSLELEGYVKGNGLDSDDAVALGYKTPVSDTLVDSSATPITAAGVYKVVADGLHVVLAYTATSGAMLIDAVPLDG